MWLFELVFPANLIRQSTDISKYFREALGIRDNESTVFEIYTCPLPIQLPYCKISISE